MNNLNMSGPKSGIVSTTGAASDNVVTYDCSSATEALGALDNCMITATALVMARVASSTDYARVKLERSFARESGTLAALDATAIVLGTSYIDAALATIVTDLDASGSLIRVRVTGVALITIPWTAYLWVSCTDS